MALPRPCRSGRGARCCARAQVSGFVPTQLGRLTHLEFDLAIDASTRDNVTAIVCDLEEGAAEDDEPIFLGSAAERFNESLESA